MRIEDLDIDKIHQMANNLIHYGQQMETQMDQKITIAELALAVGMMMGAILKQGTTDPPEASKAAMELVHRGVAGVIFQDDEDEESDSDTRPVQSNNEESGQPEG